MTNALDQGESGSPPSAAEALLETQAMLAAIGRIQSQLLTRKDAQAAFDALLAELLRASTSEYGFIGEVNYEAAGEPWLRIHSITDVAWSDDTRALVRREGGRGLEFRRLDTLIGAVLRSGEVVIANDPATDPRRGGVPAGHPALDAFLGMPFIHGARMIGMVGLANRPGGYTEDVVHTLQPVLDTVRTVIVAYRAERSRLRAEAAAVRLNRRLEASVAQLERVNRVNRAMSDMRDRLQLCQSIPDIHAVAEDYSADLLGGVGGELCLFDEAVQSWQERGHAGPRRLRVVHRWGEPGEARPDPASECAAPASLDVDAGRLCAPLAAQGEVLGELRIRLAEGGAPGEESARIEDAELLRRAAALASYLSMAIANLRMRETLRAQAIRDPLTGLFNRRQMDEVLEREVRRAVRHGDPLAVLMVDIDRFKRVNDNFGHEAGDLVIRELARCLAGAIRREDYAFRYGGEEFVLLLPGVDAASMPQRAEAILAAVRALHPAWQGRAIGPITASIGAAAYPAHGGTAPDLVRAADEAMYRAKQGGRDRAVMADTPGSELSGPGFVALV
ncbi:MAG TPA: sensor domain-containing diguanylate cyclase [Quisquiliibacterium sp.]|nr:sensor domain-containing diguanylate cyclase [Quisquiliibacterium sp.]